MPAKHPLEIPASELRWKLDPKSLPFTTTSDVQPLSDIIGQERGVEAFRFGMGVTKKGYNIFVTGAPDTGKLFTIKKLLQEFSRDGSPPCDLCYVNNFKHNEAPVLLRFKPGQGSLFKEDMQKFLDTVKREAPQLFESEEYINRKNEIAEAHERKVREFFQAVEEKVKDTGLVVVRMQMGPLQRPDLVPLVDGEPKRMVDLEGMVEAGRFPREEFERLRDKRIELKEELDQIVIQVRELQKEVGKKHDEVDKSMFLSLAEEYVNPLRTAYPEPKVLSYLDEVLKHMVDNLENIKMLGAKAQGPAQGGIMAGFGMMGVSAETLFHPYQVNLLVDNSEQKGPPVIIESFPTHRNLFGSIERVLDRMGGWHTDFTKIKAGSFVKANGGYLVVNLLDAIMEPGVWHTLKRALKTETIEIETFDPYYFITATGLKPEPIDMDVKVVVYAETRLFYLLRRYDPDTARIFKVRADFAHHMDKTDEAVHLMAGFIKAQTDKEGLRPFDASAVARVVERAVRIAGRREKLTTAFPSLADLLLEADHYAARDKARVVTADHVARAVEGKHHRSNQIEDLIQEMIDRGSLFVDTDGTEVGQVNGLAVYSLGDIMFGKPSRITAAVSMGKEGIINIEREAEMSGPTHNKGMLILAGYLRRKFAQDKPLSLAASIAFEQSYGGIDGDSASSTELYVLLSSLSDKPIRQGVAVTGSVNQKGEVQPIGGVNEKIEGFFLCCQHAGLTGDQGVMIPKANVNDLMLKPEVVDAVQSGKFHIWAVETIDQGIEILTGVKAGDRSAKSGKYPKNSINGLADTRLRELAEGLRDFGQQKKRKSRPKKTK